MTGAEGVACAYFAPPWAVYLARDANSAYSVRGGVLKGLMFGGALPPYVHASLCRPSPDPKAGFGLKSHVHGAISRQIWLQCALD